jgi:hypothetical protein
VREDSIDRHHRPWQYLLFYSTIFGSKRGKPDASEVFEQPDDFAEVDPFIAVLVTKMLYV